MRTSVVAAVIITLCLGAAAPAQQANSSGASLDLNGSTGSGSAPYSVSVQIPGPLALTVSGGANLPIVVVQGATNQVATRTFFGLGTIDVGPTPVVILDGYRGPTSHQVYNTGGSGVAVFNAAISAGTMPTGTAFAAFQAVIIDITNPPFYATISAATELTVLANQVPTAAAGSNLSVLTASSVMLNGTLSNDPESQPLTYSWLQTAGSTVTLSGATTANPSFTAPAGAGLSLADSALTFALTVHDGVQSSVPDTLTVCVNVSFVADITPMFQPVPTGFGCVGCHGFSPFCSGATGPMCLDGTGGSVHSNAFARVNLMTPASSLLLLRPLAVAGGGIPHTGGDFFTTTADAGYVTILTWILQGAADN